MARTKITPSETPSGVRLENISSGETVYQRAVILIGKCDAHDEEVEDFLAVHTTDKVGDETFPVQNWPVSEGHFKCMVILSPGENEITLKHYHEGDVSAHTKLAIEYIPLLQTPPLHLAIMIAKDSPLLIDCPPVKQGGISSAHSELEAAINKFRMTAYMWQALTAEDMRSKGLGRRSFRLEEEWTTETLSRKFLQGSRSSSMRSTAKIHLISSDKTIAELRDPDVAQQNESGSARDDLHKYFDLALKKAGSPFNSAAHPIIAGLILDSTFDQENNLIFGHAALGNSNPKGISLGMFGSHLTYSWPRFMEEVPSCLLDTKIPGDTVADDNGQCGSLWEACSIGQGAFLHEVGHAFGAPHTTGIMARGYAQDWPKNFLARTGYCTWKNEEGITVIPGETPNDACWDIKDAMSFRFQPHFKLPTDLPMSHELANVEPKIQLPPPRKNYSDLPPTLVISSRVDLAQISFNNIKEPSPSIQNPCGVYQFTLETLENRFNTSEPLRVEAVGMNGKTKTVANAWKLFTSPSSVRIPGFSTFMQKTSVMCTDLDAAREDEKEGLWEWAVMLKENGADGKIHRATEIDSRVGCSLDGAVVYFADGHHVNCGPRYHSGGTHEYQFGGHAAERFPLPEGVEITKIELGGEGDFNGLRFHMSNGKAGGYLYDDSPVQVLEPAEGDKIVGFYGKSGWDDCRFFGIVEFGIFTVPRDVELPDSVYDMAELQNTDGGIARVSDKAL